jgi:hypothetical protein
MNQNEITKLFNYKGRDILIREKNSLYQIGISGTDNDIIIWFENIEYEDFKTASLSGREYARIIIDNMLLELKKEEQNYVKKN